MKLEFVELAGFRGFRDKTRFQLPAGFTVLTGRNGVGKSTVLDAIDFPVGLGIDRDAVDAMPAAWRHKLAVAPNTEILAERKPLQVAQTSWSSCLVFAREPTISSSFRTSS